MNAREIARFRRIVLNYFKKNGRHDLPWRNFKRPLSADRQAYRILGSEVMLQQTQVERVIPYYKAWLAKFPTAKALAKASLAEVLRSWQGLGYNRRGKMLHEAGKMLTKGFPKEVKAIEALPGVGSYTARAILAFAYNEDTVFIETNIRTAVIHHFFPKKKIVSDTEIEKILQAVFPKGRAREWYAALMDYGTYLKRSGVRTNAKVKGYIKQSAFRGSDREARGAILKELAKGKASKDRLVRLLGDDRERQMTFQLEKLLQERMIAKRGAAFVLPT